MKRVFIIVIAAVLWLTTGCSSSTSSDRYIAAEAPAIEPTPSVIEQSTQTDNPQSSELSSPEKAEPTQQSENNEEPTPEKTPEPTKNTKKLTKSQQLQEAKKNNESISKAVTDSIMDKSAGQEAKGDQEASSLKEPIEHIRSLVKDLKQHADNNDADKMKAISTQIAQDWEAMKGDVQSSYPDMVDFLQEKMTKLDELQSADPIDSAAILQLDYELYQALRQLAEKAGV